MPVRIGIAAIAKGAEALILPDDVELCCPGCGTPATNESQCLIELRIISGKSKIGQSVELKVDCRKCGCSEGAPVLVSWDQ